MAEAKGKVSLEQLKAQVAEDSNETLDLFRRIRQAGKIALLGEVKRASPSKGNIAPPNFSLPSQVARYTNAGVAVVSVLTEPKWFKGELVDMQQARQVVTELLSPHLRPAILRKDFIIDEYQLYEAKLYGADSVLLIVASFNGQSNLTVDLLKHLLETSRKLGMEPLVEVATEAEAETALAIGAKVIGINNRNLHTFSVDIGTTESIMKKLRHDKRVKGHKVLVCALSGISKREDVVEVEKAGANAILVGESLMLAPSPERKAEELLGVSPVTLVKICGIKDPDTALKAADYGADLIGLVFAEKSHRKVSLEEAKEIVTSVHSIRYSQNIPDGGEVETSDNATRWFSDWASSIRRASRQCKPLVVGVFADQEAAKVNEIAEQAGLDYIQLSGIEEPTTGPYSKPVIKAIHVGAQDTADSVKEKIQKWVGKAVAILLDTHTPDARGGTGETFDWTVATELSKQLPIILAGGLSPNNISSAVTAVAPFLVDVSSGVETDRMKDTTKIKAFIEMAKFPFHPAALTSAKERHRQYKSEVEKRVAQTEYGYFADRFGDFGGSYVPETLVEPIQQLEKAYWDATHDPTFWAQVHQLARHYVGRPTELYYAKRLSEAVGGAKIWLKREDLAHTGAHKINNAIAQALLAQRLGKKRIVAETGAGQHGVATATACAMLKLECIVYMGGDDTRRQSLNVFRMKTLGTTVVPVEAGSRTLKDAINEALRDWVTNVTTTHYLIGSAIGPHPFPTIVRDFQSVIGKESRAQMIEQAGKLPDVVVSCVGGGSNSIGMFYPYYDDNVRIVGAEAAGEGVGTGKHSATLGAGRPGVLHGTRTYLLQDEHGQVLDTHSISAGLDYPGVGPEHAWLRESKRVEYVGVTDTECMEGFTALAKNEGIIPALESSHAIYAAMKIAATMRPDQDVLVGLSGRGDKDMMTVAKVQGVTLE